MNEKHPLEIAADHVGGASKLAAILGVSVQAVGNWKERGIPLERCLAVENATGGKVSRRHLREDWLQIWPELAKPRKAKQEA